MKKHSLVSILTLALIVVAGATALAQSTALFRYVADTQWAPPNAAEYSSSAAPLPAAGGGTVTYSRTFFNLHPVLYISFDGAAATHNGSTLLMACTVNGAPCTPAGGGGSPSALIPTGWVGLLKPDPAVNCLTVHIALPPLEAGDCHTNNINYTWCVPNVASGAPVTIELKLASLPPTSPLLLLTTTDRTVHYERAHIIVDGTKQQVQTLCAPAPLLNGPA
jgi:hypothetical protein